MLHYMPADWIAGALGGDSLGTIALAALVGVPAYLNGYAAIPLVDAMLTQGMSPGAAMSFIIAGGVTCHLHSCRSSGLGTGQTQGFHRLSGLCRHRCGLRRHNLASHQLIACPTA